MSTEHTAPRWNIAHLGLLAGIGGLVSLGHQAGWSLQAIAWAATGPLFHFSDTWQLVINTGTTIITFLMVFLIQNSQNREGQALQAKLDELLRALETAQNRYIGLEQRTEQEILEMRAEIEEEAGVEPTEPGMSATRAAHPSRVAA